MAGSDEVAFPEDGTVSAEARELLLALLQKNPDRRLSLHAVLDLTDRTGRGELSGVEGAEGGGRCGVGCGGNLRL